MAEEHLENQAEQPETVLPETPAAPESAPVEPPAEPVEESQPVASESDSRKKWYVIQTYSGMEEKVRDAILNNLGMMKMEKKVFQILVPEEEIVELKGTKRIEKKRKMFPGYVFLEMELDDESWYAIRQTPGVARFIGTKVKPTPVSDREMQRVLKQIGVKGEKLEVAFERGESVRVISGPFRGYTGTVDEINVDKGTLKVLINIFGRDTPVEVNFEHAEKVV
jgi:transcriptional antiterminator NusG